MYHRISGNIITIRIHTTRNFFALITIVLITIVLIT
jgi:hypothetical protein